MRDSLRLALAIVAAQGLAMALMLGAAAVVVDTESSLAAGPIAPAAAATQCRSATRDALDMLLF